MNAADYHTQCHKHAHELMKYSDSQEDDSFDALLLFLPLTEQDLADRYHLES